MAECAFCQIVTGERDAYVIYEDEQTAAFLDSHPAIQGHTLVAPRTHHKYLFTGDESRAMAVFRTVRRVAMGINQTLEPDGVSLFYTSADLVGQVTHAHVYLLPRYTDDNIHLALARESLNDEEAARLVAHLRDNL
jgi:histidine triad (HIT) family protein